MAADWTERGFQRRIIGYHGFRLDGISDLLTRCHGASVLDIGCNRGMASYEFALSGASLCHGCDNYETGMLVANEVFADLRNVQAKFEVVDLIGGPGALKKAFGTAYLKQYDFVLMLAVYHKLRRVMSLDALLFLVEHLAHHCGRYFVWRGSREEKSEFEHLLKEFKLVHYSEMAEVLLPGETTPTPQPAAVWLREEWGVTNRLR